MEHILDDQLTKGKTEQSLLATIKWWEYRRGFFNFSVGVAGVLPMLFFWDIIADSNYFVIIFFAIVYGFIANVCYCLSWGIDVLRWYYLKDTNFGKYKEILLIGGIVFSIGLTMMLSAGTWLSIGIGMD